MARTGPRQPGPPAGVIFGCNRSSEEESLNGLFGMSSGHWSLVKEIVPGTPCFLFNFNTKELHGVFKAVSAGGWNIDPLAYGGKPKEGSMYPAQVRVEYCPRCPPMEERYFKPAIAENYFNPNRFRWELSERQVEQLLDLYLGKGAPWPPRNTGPAGHRSSSRPWSSPGRLEPPRDSYGYNDHATTRGFAAEPRGLQEGPSYRDRSYAPVSPIESHMGRPISHMAPRLPESLAPRSLLPSHSDHRARRPGLPEDLRLRAPESLTDSFRPAPTLDSFTHDVRATLPMLSASMFSAPMDLHPVTSAMRGPSFSVSRSASPTQLPVQAGRYSQQPSAQPDALPWDFSSTANVGDQFSRLGTDTSILKEPVGSTPMLSAELTMSERFQQLPRHALDQDAAHASSGPLRISLSSTAGRSVSIPQPTPVPSPSRVSQAVVTSDPMTLVVGSIPHSCTITGLVSILDQFQRDHYDFLHYQSSDEFDSTAIVNFIRPEYARDFEEQVHDISWSDLHSFDPPTSAIASVTPHTTQGKDALLAQHGAAARRFGGGPSNEATLPVNRPLFFYAGKKRPAVQDQDAHRPSSRPRLPSARDLGPGQAAVQGRHSQYPDQRSHHSDHHRISIKMEPDAAPAGFEQHFGQSLPTSPAGMPSHPTSPSNMSEADRAHIRSRPGSAAAVASRPPPGESSNPLKITIKQEPNMGQPVTPSPDSALDVMPPTLSALHGGPSRGVSSSPNQAHLQSGNPEAAAFLQNLNDSRSHHHHQHQSQQDQRSPSHQSRSPSRQPRSPSRHQHRHQSSRQHSSRSGREDEQQQQHNRPASLSHRHRNGSEHRSSSKGVHKVSSREHKSSRSSRERDSSRHRSKAADLKPSSRSKADQLQDVQAAANKAFEVFVDTAPMYPDLPNSMDMDFRPAHDAAHAPMGYGESRLRPIAEEAVADNSMGLQHSEGQHADNSNAAAAMRKQQQPLHNSDSLLPAAVRHAEFGADFLAVPMSP